MSQPRPTIWSYDRRQAVRRMGLALFFASLLILALKGISLFVALIVPGQSFFEQAVEKVVKGLSWLWQFLISLVSNREAGSIEHWSPWVGSLIFVGVVAKLLHKSRFIAQIDLLFFAPFDTETFSPIRSNTGLLRWHLPSTADMRAGKLPVTPDDVSAGESTQQRVWDNHKAWMESGMGDGRWKGFWRRPDLPIPFSWAVLVGPNGMGKTQLAKELGRAFAHRSDFGDKGRRLPLAARLRQRRGRLAEWWRLLKWWVARSPDDAWDAGLLPRGEVARQARLAQWRPRRPTVIVLDEPQDQDWNTIDTLLVQSRHFWHPVRLLFVDQALPWKPFVAITETLSSRIWEPTASGAYGGRFLLDGFTFTERNARPLIPVRVRPQAGDPEGNGEPKALWQTQRLNRFLAATRGDSVLVALGVHWLSKPGNTLDALTGVELERDEVALTQGHAGERLEHRLIDARLEELLQTLRSVKKLDAPLIKAIGCATLVGGLDFEQARAAFGVDELAADLALLFPHFAAGDSVSSQFPAIKPTLIGDRFLVDKLAALLGGDENRIYADLVRDGWRLNPGGMLRALARLRPRLQALAHAAASTSFPLAGGGGGGGGRTPGACVDSGSSDLLPPSQPSPWQGEGAIRQRRCRALLAALDSLPEPANSGVALELARGFAEAAIRHGGSLASALAMQRKARAFPAPDLCANLLNAAEELARAPDAAGLPAVSLYCEAAAAGFAELGPDSTENLLTRVLDILQARLPSIGWRGIPSDEDRATWLSTWQALLETPPLRSLLDSDAGCARLDRHLAQAAWNVIKYVRPMQGALALQRLAHAASGNAVDAWRALWSLMAESAQANLTNSEKLALPLVSGANLLLAARAHRYQAYVHCLHGDVVGTRSAVDRIEAIATQEDWRRDRLMQRVRTATWYVPADAHTRQRDVDGTRAAVDRVEAIATQKD